MGCHLDFALFICHCLGINNISLFYSFIYIVCLFLSQTHGLFVLDVVAFPPVFSLNGKNEMVPFLPFTILNILFLPQSQQDNSLVSSSVKMLGLHHHNQVLHQLLYWGILMQSDSIPCIYSTLHDHSWYFS